MAQALNTVSKQHESVDYDAIIQKIREQSTSPEAIAKREAWLRAEKAARENDPYPEYGW